jgi:hypothetical protein
VGAEARGLREPRAHPHLRRLDRPEDLASSARPRPVAVGRLLVALGEQVGSLAESDSGAPVAARLSQLGALLIDGGNALANR